MEKYSNLAATPSIPTFTFHIVIGISWDVGDRLIVFIASCNHLMLSLVNVSRMCGRSILYMSIDHIHTVNTKWLHYLCGQSYLKVQIGSSQYGRCYYQDILVS